VLFDIATDYYDCRRVMRGITVVQVLRRHPYGIETVRAYGARSTLATALTSTNKKDDLRAYCTE